MSSSQQNSSLTVSSPLSEVKLKPQVLEEINDYKGIPWGLDFEKFKKLKNYDGTLGEPTNKSDTGNYWQRCLAAVVGAPVRIETIFGYKLIDVESHHIPNKLCTVYIKEDEVYYIFYDGKFAMAFSILYAKNYDEIHSFLSAKYQAADSLSKEVMTVGSPPNNDIVSFISDSFKGRNATVFLIKQKYDSPPTGYSSTSVGLFYASDKYYNLIRSAIDSSIADQNKSKRETDKKDLESDFGKIK